MSGFRNLTGSSPNTGGDYTPIDNNSTADPFGDHAVESSYDEYSSNSGSLESQRMLNTPSSQLNPFSDSVNNVSSTQALPKSYQNYPQGLTGARIGSALSENSDTNLTNPNQYLKNNINNSPRDSGLSAPSTSYNNYGSGSVSGSVSGSGKGGSTSPSNDSDKSPYLVDDEFSPFGGYPPSCFPLSIDEKEADDYIHNPDPITDADYEKHRFKNDLKNMDRKSIFGLIGFLLLAIGALALFVILPALTYTGVTDKLSQTGGTWNETYVKLTEYTYPTLSAIRTSLIDSDTPDYAMSRQARDGSYWGLTFSDEFNAEGRTFYEGDDQFWYAPDFNYAATEDLDWYDPDAVTTANGTLQLKMDAYQNHDLFYRSGMVHSWNRLCFTQGIMEVSIKLPNYGNSSGLWPGAWSMGNLGRPGYMASTDGVWPYAYEACDAGITANQSAADGISYLPGQRLNACTCKGEDHPNPGTGRGAPEIDVLEAAMDTTLKCGVASQSMQVAPFDIWYIPDYNWIEIHNNTLTSINTYCGGPFQEAISAVSTLNPSWYELGDGSDIKHNFQKYAYEYLNDNDDGYCRWFVGDDPTFTLHANALAPNGNIDWRRISKEPMSMIINLGISNSWAYIDWPGLHFPTTMYIDYVRIYQPNDSVSMTCDPSDFPTYDYINDHPVAYQNVNKTSWSDAGYAIPKNKLTGC